MSNLLTSFVNAFSRPSTQERNYSIGLMSPSGGRLRPAPAFLREATRRRKHKRGIMIFSYHRPSGVSRIAKALRLAIQYPNHTDVVLRPRRNRLPDLNWGIARPFSDMVLNHDIRIAISKNLSFSQWARADLPVPRWSKDLATLRSLLPEGRQIIARQDGLSGGRGMQLVEEGKELLFRPDFYVERLSCRREFRIHVFRGEVILRQAKLLPEGYKGIAKNHEQGCFFTSERVERFATEEQFHLLDDLSLRAVEALKLDFGAVDLLISKKDKPYLLEVNTAPGLRTENSFLAYKRAFEKLYNIG